MQPERGASVGRARSDDVPGHRVPLQETGYEAGEPQDTGRAPEEQPRAADHAEAVVGAESDTDVAPRRSQQWLRWNVIARVLNWLRAGYPDGVPRADYLALYAVLRRHLSDGEIEAIAEEVARANPDTEITRDDIEVAVARFAKQQPEPADVARVAAGLADAGWPLADQPWDQE